MLGSSYLGAAPLGIIITGGEASAVVNPTGIASTSSVGNPVIIAGAFTSGPVPQRGIIVELENFFSESQNLIPDPCFESGARNVHSEDQVNSELTAVIGMPTIEGDYSLLVASGDQCTLANLAWSAGMPLSAGIDVAYASADATLGILFFDDALSSPLIQANQATVTGIEPQTLTLTAVSPPTTTRALIYVRCDGGGTAVFDRAIATDSPTAVPFFNGASGGCTWDSQGTYSTSSRNGTPVFLQDMIRSAAPYWSSNSSLVSV